MYVHYVLLPMPYILLMYIRLSSISLGLNTKVAQTVAKQLGVPIELVVIKPTDALISPNNIVTGGSTTSERCCSVSTINFSEML